MSKNNANPKELKKILMMAFIGLDKGEIEVEKINGLVKTANAICNVVRTELQVAGFQNQYVAQEDKKKKIAF